MQISFSIRQPITRASNGPSTISMSYSLAKQDVKTVILARRYRRPALKPVFASRYPLVQLCFPAPTWLYRLVDPGVRSRVPRDAHPVPLAKVSAGSCSCTTLSSLPTSVLISSSTVCRPCSLCWFTLAAAGDFGPATAPTVVATVWPEPPPNWLPTAAPSAAPPGAGAGWFPARALLGEAALLYRAVFHLGAGARDNGRTRQGEQAVTMNALFFTISTPVTTKTR